MVRINRHKTWKKFLIVKYQKKKKTIYKVNVTFNQHILFLELICLLTVLLVTTEQFKNTQWCRILLFPNIKYTRMFYKPQRNISRLGQNKTGTEPGKRWLNHTLNTDGSLSTVSIFEKQISMLRYWPEITFHILKCFLKINTTTFLMPKISVRQNKM
jgi:hypothetical protein